MKGDLADVIARLFRWLPAGWFPWKSVNSDGTVPKVWLTQLGFATILSPIYALLQYIGLQTRTATSTDGWLDLRGWDLLGDWLPRLPGETDTLYQARIARWLLHPANTKAAISDAIEQLTGSKPQLMESWNPQDNGVLDGGPGAGAMYYDADSLNAPARLVDPSLRGQFFIESTVPSITNLGNASLPAYDAPTYYDTSTAAYIDLTAVQSQGITSLYNIIERFKAYGIVGWTKIVPFPARPSLFWDEPGVIWDNNSQWDNQTNG